MSELKISALIMREIICCFLEKCTHLALLAPPVVVGNEKSHSEFLKLPWHDIIQNRYAMKTYIERWSYFCGVAMAMVFFHGFPRSKDAIFAIYLLSLSASIF